MEPEYQIVEDLREITAPAAGIVSKTLQNDGRSKVIQFCFAPGQELSAHTAPFPAILQIVRGKAVVRLGAAEHRLEEGALIYMGAQLVHGIQAETELVLLLILLKNA